MDIVRGVLNVCSLITILFVFYTIIEYIKHMIKIIKNRRLRDLFTLEPVKEGLRSLEIKNEWAAKVFIIVLIIGGLYGVLSLTVKVESIGHFFEKREYKTYYYINLFPGENSTKNYRVKGEIFATFHENDDSSERIYLLEKAYFSKGRYISFGDYDLEPLKIGKKITLTDNSGRPWYVELTDKKADPP
jgi:hypothetical protein